MCTSRVINLAADGLFICIIIMVEKINYCVVLVVAYILTTVIQYNIILFIVSILYYISIVYFIISLDYIIRLCLMLMVYSSGRGGCGRGRVFIISLLLITLYIYIVPAVIEFRLLLWSYNISLLYRYRRGIYRYTNIIRI